MKDPERNIKYLKCPKCGCQEDIYYERSYLGLFNNICCPSCGYADDEQFENDWIFTRKRKEVE